MSTVLYTDPAWLLNEDGHLDPALASIEHDLLSGANLRFGPHDGTRYNHESSELRSAAKGADVLVVYRAQVTEDLLDAAGPGLRGVVRQGVGIDNLNAALLADRGLPAFNVPDYCVAEVAAHTSALALALERQLVVQHQTLVAGRFDIYAGGVPRRLTDRVLGIVGFGRIGRALARSLGTFYGEVLTYDPYLGRDLAEGYGARAVDSFEELLQRSHMVSLHCPLNAETENMMNVEAFELMRPDAFVVNAARGKLIDPLALGKALDSHAIAGAGLDVFFPENPHDDSCWEPVLSHPNVIATSHRAFLSREAELSSRRRVAETVKGLLEGTNVVVGRVDA